MTETTAELAERIMARLAERRSSSPFDATSWTAANELADLAPAGQEPVYAYAHDLDDADLGETRGYDQDATGLASPQPVRTRLVPSPVIQETLDQLVAGGRAERHPAIPGKYRPA